MGYFQFLFAKEHRMEILRITTVGIASILFWLHILPLSVLLVAIAFGVYSLIKTAVLELVREKKIGTELFISIAVIVGVLGKEYLAAAIVLMIILIAEYIASVNTEKTRASIQDLIGTIPTTITVYRNNKEITVKLESVRVGDIILARTGERLPVDGIIIKGTATINQAPITGESTPQEKKKDDTVYAGTIITTGAINIKVTKLVQDTVFARIIKLVEDAEQNKAPIEKLTDKVATYLIPIAFLFVIGIYWYTRDVKMVIAALIFMSPAELGLATPLVTISAVARAAKEGILIKGGLYLEELAKVDTFVFDKTGTLTTGMPNIQTVTSYDQNYTQNDVLSFAASADRRSSHPIAKSIVAYAAQKKIRLVEPTRFTVVHGRGARATVNGKNVLVGNKKFLTENNIEVSQNATRTTIFVAVNKRVIGAITINDTIRPEAKKAIEALRKSGVKHFVMLTGDNEESAQTVARAIGITEWKANLLPEEKIDYIKKLQKHGRIVAMVGDGINDAPALAQASIGLAMGAIGTQAAMEAADVVLVNDNLLKIARAKAISKRSYRTIKENVFVGVGVVHVIGITLVLLRIIGPVEAAAIHLVPDVAVLLNSVKLLRVNIQ
ncbi:cadmium-translocating P-type ATPase [Candidatus Woesearchaeota archaeon]|nr:cadmium-translocating P-type ATPase [Candidatus Woesearchaeota archaeon]